ncbi:hypothetical protein STEG23_018592, partial [Scotinomys teguina]
NLHSFGFSQVELKSKTKQNKTKQNTPKNHLNNQNKSNNNDDDDDDDDDDDNNNNNNNNSNKSSTNKLRFGGFLEASNLFNPGEAQMKSFRVSLDGKIQLGDFSAYSSGNAQPLWRLDRHATSLRTCRSRQVPNQAARSLHPYKT